MNNLIDSLVNVSISITNSNANESAFNNMLLMDLEGLNENDGYSGIHEFTTISQVALAGWDEDTKIYKAAYAAFRNGAATLYIYVPTESEGLTDSLEKAAKNSGWYGLMLIQPATDDTETEGDTPLQIAAAWCEENHRLLGFVVDISGVNLKEEATKATTGNNELMPVSTDYFYSVAYASCLEEHPDNEFMAVAAFAKYMTYQSGSETWYCKSLREIEPEDWDADDRTCLEQLGFNAYATCSGQNITLNGKVVAGEWIDVVRFRDWLVDDMQTRVFAVFKENSKVPYTDAGIALIQNQMITSLKTGQEVGGIVEIAYDEDGNEISGFSTSVPRASSISGADRMSRILHDCTFTATLEHAIHMVEITGELST